MSYQFFIEMETLKIGVKWPNFKNQYNIENHFFTLKKTKYEVVE